MIEFLNFPNQNIIVAHAISRLHDKNFMRNMLPANSLQIEFNVLSGIEAIKRTKVLDESTKKAICKNNFFIQSPKIYNFSCTVLCGQSWSLNEKKTYFLLIPASRHDCNRWGCGLKGPMQLQPLKHNHCEWYQFEREGRSKCGWSGKYRGPIPKCDTSSYRQVIIHPRTTHSGMEWTVSFKAFFSCRLGLDINSAQVGDTLALRFEIEEKESPYEIFVRDLVAMDGLDSSEIVLIDSRGWLILGVSY